MVVDEVDRKVWELVSDVPLVHKYLSIFVALINLIFPGFGTMIASCASSGESVSKTQLSIGLVQFLTSFVLIGWIWAIYWGYLIVKKAFATDG